MKNDNSLSSDIRSLKLATNSVSKKSCVFYPDICWIKTLDLVSKCRHQNIFLCHLLPDKFIILFWYSVIPGVQKCFTSFRRPIILAILVEIISHFYRMYRNRGFYIERKNTIRAYEKWESTRDASVMMEMKTVFWWNSRRSHRTYSRVISFNGDV